jgi:hypothetical protein
VPCTSPDGEPRWSYYEESQRSIGLWFGKTSRSSVEPDSVFVSRPCRVIRVSSLLVVKSTEFKVGRG